MASCTTSFGTNLENSKMAAKQPAKIGFQTFEGAIHYGSHPNFIHWYMEVEYSPSSILD
jgi:hypothetical protein